MDAKYNAALHEDRIYRFWEEHGYFQPGSDSKQHFSIVLPPPNANADLHLGHAMYVYEDVMIRYHKLQGASVFWLAGADHAGIETQFVYEKHLKKEGKSRFDFDRETLYQNIWDFVMNNRSTMENQLRHLGFALDWSRTKFTMDQDIIKIVYRTFQHMFEKGLAYRANKLVNYCTMCGTSFSDLEVVDKETDGALYHIRYPVDGGGNIIIATTRPETMVGDTAVMVHPKDSRYTQYIGKTVTLPLIHRKIPVIADEVVDMKFGTGAVKVTPSHDLNDYEVAKRHNLPSIQVIGFDGKMMNSGVVDGLRVKAARVQVLELLKKDGYFEKEIPHHLVQKACYRCGTVLEPLPKEQWFIKTRPLADRAIQLVEKDEIQIHPKRFKKQLIRILERFIDWNVSRQIVWGIRIPAYRCVASTKNTLADKWFVSVEKPEHCAICGKCAFVQDDDTFDTWFSSAQWPYATLEALSGESRKENKDLFKNFYPNSVMETGYDILRAWVARMIMVGYFETSQVPFRHVFLHGMVRDAHGQKMSKSKGNVINPLDMVQKYGADSLRAALIFGTQEGGDVVLSEQKIVGMRNFGNKLWNIGRFFTLESRPSDSALTDETRTQLLKDLKKEMSAMEKKYHGYMKRFLFSKAFDLVYDFTWHRFADVYIEQLKADVQNGNIGTVESLKGVYDRLLRTLHPYMPFVTEAIWQEQYGQEKSILDMK